MMREGFDRMLAAVRADVANQVGSHFHQDVRVDFDALRKAMIVAEALDYMGLDIPEARELVGEVRDLIMQLRAAKAPMLQHFL